MIDLTRRDAMLGLGAASAAATMPLFPVESADLAEIERSLAALGKEVGLRVSEFERLKAPLILEQGAVSREVFTTTPITTDTARVGSFRLSSAHDEMQGQRFVFASTPASISRYFVAVADNDTRAEVAGSKPVRISQLEEALHSVAVTHRVLTEMQAARVLNTALTYDVTVGGDGVSLCSHHHPYDGGVWSNIIEGNPDLTPAGLLTALTQIQTSAVDDQGLRIILRASKLVVPVALADKAKEALAALGETAVPTMSRTPVVCPELAGDSWFVRTDLPWALVNWMREPFSLDCYVEHVYGSVVVKSHQKASWSFADPRGVFGSFPSMRDHLAQRV